MDHNNSMTTPEQVSAALANLPTGQGMRRPWHTPQLRRSEVGLHTLSGTGGFADMVRTTSNKAGS